jgi:hypothetical protein
MLQSFISIGWIYPVYWKLDSENSSPIRTITQKLFPHRREAGLYNWSRSDQQFRHQPSSQLAAHTLNVATRSKIDGVHCPRPPLESNCHLMIENTRLSDLLYIRHWSVGPHRIENTHEPYRPNRSTHASAPSVSDLFWFCYPVGEHTDNVLRSTCKVAMVFSCHGDTDMYPLFVLCQLSPVLFSSTPCLLALGSLLVRDDRYTHKCTPSKKAEESVTDLRRLYLVQVYGCFPCVEFKF